jgi:hypothetical protein
MDETTLTQLGRAVAAPASPDEAVLERVPNPQAGALYLAVSPRRNSPRSARSPASRISRGW